MLRDGLHPSLLDENEKELYISTFGQESFDEFLTTLRAGPNLAQSKTPPKNLECSMGSTPSNSPNRSQKVAHLAAKKRKDPTPIKPNSSKRLAFE
jgi:hypothetical protein